jgi:flagellar basal-body rod modification protein FlgD
MADQIALPASILTSKQYEDQQMLAKYDTEAGLGRDAFLKLFTTQLTNQNPLEPMDNEAFVSQLAQFSSLESMKAMQASMDTVANIISAEKFVNGSNMLGRYVANDYGVVTAGEGTAAKASVMLDNGAEQMIVRAFDADGKEVYTRSFGRQTPGEIQINWSGEDNDGNLLPYGAYKIVVSALLGNTAKAVPVNALEQIKAVHWNSENKDFSVETASGRILGSAEITTLQI